MPETSDEYKPHAVCLPFPAQGHINPMFKLAILLHSRGFLVTFVNTEYNHRRLLRSRGPDSLNGLPDFNFETIPDGLPPTDADATQDIPSLCDSTRKNCLAPFLSLLKKLNSSADSPPVTCIIADAIMSFSVLAAKEIEVPCVCFRTTNASSFLVNRYFPLLKDKGLIPLKDSTYLSNGYLDRTLDFIPELKNLRLRDLPSFTRATNPGDELMVNIITEEAKRASRATAIMLNTFDALEGDILRSLSGICSPIFTVGPIQRLLTQLPENGLKFIGANLWKEEPECLQWLDSKPPNSVVYVNFGSIAVLTQQQLTEFALGLATSKKDFLWIIRSDLVAGDSIILPPEFLEATKGQGLIARWCPQEQVLDHPSVGAFLTHCGWNSMLESLASGVPMICWPFFAEQHMNCRFACNEWDVGMEIDSDVKRNEVEKLVREVIDGENGKNMKNKAAELKKKVQEATGINGSSFLNFEKLVNEVLKCKPLMNDSDHRFSG